MTKQKKNPAKGSKQLQQHKDGDSSDETQQPSDTPVHETDTSPSSSMAREKHNKKSVRPPVFFHREYEEPHGYLSQWYISSFTDPKTN
jgi:hypothetical protein